jgi:hypothetical protein
MCVFVRVSVFEEARQQLVCQEDVFEFLVSFSSSISESRESSYKHGVRRQFSLHRFVVVAFYVGTRCHYTMHIEQA